MDECKYLVVGGGIAGVTCAEQLSQMSPDSSITLLSASDVIKSVANLKYVTRVLTDFDVEEQSASVLAVSCPNVKVVLSKLVGLDPTAHTAVASDGQVFKYGKLCLCMGGSPKLFGESNEYCLTIRDTDSVKEFQRKLSTARRVVLVGNGGIATELAYEISNCDVIWVIKDKFISRTFIDAGAAEFFLPLLTSRDIDRREPGPVKRMKYTVTEYTDYEQKNAAHRGPPPMVMIATRQGVMSSRSAAYSASGSGEVRKDGVQGGALGPDWTSELAMAGSVKECFRHVTVEYESEVSQLFNCQDFKASKLFELYPLDHNDRYNSVHDWHVYVKLTTGKVIGCDFVVSATGTSPNTPCLSTIAPFEVCEEKGLYVDHQMRTNINDVYAAGDICTPRWEWAAHWFQMRLWSQARQMGAYAAKCMMMNDSGDESPMDFCFELFAHITNFFGFKVVLLGKYNAQGLGNDYELLLRCTPGQEYVKVVLQDGRMQGAILIGEADLEETFENLILNQMDLSRYGESLLDPNIDIEDYFD